MTLGVSEIWATVWATTTGAVATESSGDNGFADIDHLQIEQLIRPVGVPYGRGLGLLGELGKPL